MLRERIKQVRPIYNNRHVRHQCQHTTIHKQHKQFIIDDKPNYLRHSLAHNTATNQVPCSGQQNVGPNRRLTICLFLSRGLHNVRPAATTHKSFGPSKVTYMRFALPVNCSLLPRFYSSFTLSCPAYIPTNEFPYNHFQNASHI